ncbi:STAS domain-containing protein [Nannocystis punicea]|uniref:STAS domain-containing protein n=1 Tax=Nannocystis punicea TaxID=2995304 RepID=A0ABY7GVS6_9BACT|nr:STAS domain-containing protein [Nannocystis poenicansa]WAS91078.1 STAS domain-containing protein [Nannocystis poenicansa]
MDEQQRAEVTDRVARVHADLMRAKDEAGVLRAVAEAVGTYAPALLELSYVHLDGERRPHEVEFVAWWRSGEVGEHPGRGQRLPLAGLTLAERWTAARSEPVIVPDIADDPQVVEVLRQRGLSSRALALLPLYSERHDAWQGVLGIHWDAPRVASADEISLYHLLARTVAEAIAGERTLRQLRRALAENQALLAETQRALRETRAQQETLRVVLDHLPIGVEVLDMQTNARELVNRAGQEILGLGGQSDRIDATANNAFRPGAAEPIALEDHPVARTFAAGETVRMELEFVRGTGERARLDLTSAPLRYPGDPAPRVVLLYQDVTASRRLELERMQAQEELLRVQAAALAERSTPLIPITRDVVVMPLIGTVDPERGAQILATLTHLGGSNRVHAAILDVTGVSCLDAAAADALVTAARAVRLRGVQPVLTGIQPAVAATLVAHGVDLSGVQVCGTLEDGVAWATRARR